MLTAAVLDTDTERACQDSLQELEDVLDQHENQEDVCSNEKLVTSGDQDDDGCEAEDGGEYTECSGRADRYTVRLVLLACGEEGVRWEESLPLCRR